MYVCMYVCMYVFTCLRVSHVLSQDCFGLAFSEKCLKVFTINGMRADIEGPDQSAHPHSLIRIFAAL